ncbi:MAG TPA: 4a-hydroxytetrahydrobiopterin dehydratase [Rhodanobacteraceae bacterium]|nr:4a-hydroxytetrahydrobiopterin dehydratase [Rhodanobacteraceae bacterium]
MSSEPSLSSQSCQPRKGEGDALADARVGELLAQVKGWTRADDGKRISRDFRFDDFYHTLGFVNAVGWMANQQDHHPDLEVGYGHCRVTWSTHSVGGLSMNDFICAARTDALHGG